MALQEELDWDNTVSKNRQRDSRARRKSSRDAKKERSSRLRAATSTKERREIKADYEKKSGGIWDISTSDQKVSNNSGSNVSVDSSSGIDSAFENPTSSGGGGGGLPDGFAEETLDIVDSNNLAAQRIFLTKDVV